MKKMIGSLLLVELAWNLGVAGFVPSTPAQIDLAAQSPEFTAELVRDASAAQAAEIIRSIILKITSSKNPNSAADATKKSAARTKSRIMAVMRSAFDGKTPEQAQALARALGAACGNAVLIADNAHLISWIQEAIAAVGGPTIGTQLANDFGVAFTVAVSPLGSAGFLGQNQNQAPPPPEPRPYPGQE